MAGTFDYDAELRRYQDRLMAAALVDDDALVLDVGCGTGLTTRSAALAAPRGYALGVDISAAMLDRARQLTNLANARFELGDAQVHPFAPGHFSLAISRFGTMFFADPSAAFTNIARALRPGARFVQLVWQDGSRQAWRTATQLVLTGDVDTPARQVAFSLADPAQVHDILGGAGFEDIQLTEVCEPVYYGADLASAVHAIRSLQMSDEMVTDLDQATAERAVDRLRTVRDDGVWFDSCAWLVTARRASA